MCTRPIPQSCGSRAPGRASRAAAASRRDRPGTAPPLRSVTTARLRTCKADWGCRRPKRREAHRPKGPQVREDTGSTPAPAADTLSAAAAQCRAFDCGLGRPSSARRERAVNKAGPHGTHRAILSDRTRDAPVIPTSLEGSRASRRPEPEEEERHRQRTIAVTKGRRAAWESDIRS